MYIINIFELEAVEDDDDTLFSLMKDSGVATDATFFTQQTCMRLLGWLAFTRGSVK